jgi:glycosyltransferase involved in cell wall biosynthesis
LSLPFLSLIIPVYNEAKRLPSALEQAYAYLQQQDYTFEVIVVENGSQDNTLQIALDFAQKHPRVRVLEQKQRGKGLAVKRGMLQAQGAYRFMCDVDFSMPISEIQRFLPPALKDFDIAIASREAPGSVRYHEPAHRHVIGRIYNSLIRWLLLPGLQDTQCGFKCFRAEVAKDLFPRQTLTGWSFDVEILFIARQRGYRIVEVPIAWYYNANSRIHLVRDSLQMGLDLLTIRWNAWRGVYGSSN